MEENIGIWTELTETVYASSRPETMKSDGVPDLERSAGKASPFLIFLT